MANDLKINKTYTFNTRAPAILGSLIINAQLVSILNFEGASLYDNVALKYEQIYPVIASLGVPSSAKNETFYRFKTQSGQYIIIADSWIDGSTLSGFQNITFTVTVNNATTEQQNAVTSILKSIGVNFSLEVLPNSST